MSGWIKFMLIGTSVQNFKKLIFCVRGIMECLFLMHPTSLSGTAGWLCPECAEFRAVAHLPQAPAALLVTVARDETVYVLLL